MKKFIIAGAALVALAVPAVASAEYSVPATASCNGAMPQCGPVPWAKGLAPRPRSGRRKHDLRRRRQAVADGPATDAANSAHRK